MDEIDREIMSRIPRVFRDRSSPFDTLTDVEFRRRYRFSRNGFFHLVDVLGEDITCKTNRSKPLLPAQRLGVALSYLATGGFQTMVGDLSGCSQSSVSRIAFEVCSAIAARSGEFVVWPNAEEQLETSKCFKTLTGIPGIVGCLDGTHVKIPAPSIEEHLYVNRKNYHSINVGVMCDDKLRFTWFSCKFPGSAHDSRVFRESECYKKFVRRERNGIILADSAYRAERFLLKPIINAKTEPEKRYTDSVCRGRVLIENSIGTLKRQWHSLHSELRTNPTRATIFIVSAICLRNASIDLKEKPFEKEDDEEEDVVDDYINEEPPSSGGSAMQAFIIRKFFS